MPGAPIKRWLHVGAQDLGGALLWLLPNPTGLQAHYQLSEINEMFKSPFVATEAA